MFPLVKLTSVSQPWLGILEVPACNASVATGHASWVAGNAAIHPIAPLDDWQELKCM